MNHLTTMKLSQCFVILNATPSMAWEDVKKSYHRLAKKYHPDLNPRSIRCENKFKELNGAFKMLETHYKDPKKNRRQSVFSVFRMRPKVPSRPTGGELHPAEIIDEDSPSKSTVPTSSVKQKKTGISHWPQKIQNKFNKLERKIFLLDTQKSIRVAPQTAAQGGLIRLNNRKETFQVKIPSGDWKRMSLRVPEKGETSFFGKKRGDLVLNIQVIQPDQLDAGRSRFFYDFQVTQEKIKSSRVQTLDSVQGPIKFVLPRNTKDGQVFVLKYNAGGDSASSPDHMVKVHLN
jgi:curved DNA-binding protein